MSGRYAAKTDVPVDRSRTEIEQLLRKHGATAFTYGWDETQAVVMFEMARRRMLFRLPMPDRASREFTRTDTGRLRAAAEAGRAYDQAVRSRWRALLLVLRAKLEAVATGIVGLETEFLPYVQLSDGRTVAEYALPAIEKVYESGDMPALLPGGGS